MTVTVPRPRRSKSSAAGFWGRQPSHSRCLAGLLIFMLFRHGASIPSEKKIAVLPFRNIGDQAANQAFCDGVMETIASSLTEIERFHGTLWVAPASEVRREGVSSSRDAARALGVNLTITGSVQREGNRVRLIANLVDAQTLRQLRSVQVTRGLDELSELQDWLTQATADMLDLELRPQARQALAEGRPPCPPRTICTFRRKDICSGAPPAM